MFSSFKLNEKEAIFIQVYNYLKNVIENGMLPNESKLPSTREMGIMLKVSRTTVIKVYELLQDKGLVYTVQGKGTFVSKVPLKKSNEWNIDWVRNCTSYAKKAESLDIMKHGEQYKKGMISFKSIAPDEKLFDLEEVKRAFLNRISIEGEKLLNYGYAKGYELLIDFMMKYMKNKGVNIKNKDILITNGFTEGFDIVLSAIAEKGDKIICENPTHNTAIKLMKLHELDIIGININSEGIDLKQLKSKLQSNKIRAAYIIPSYHNPTGMVMPYEKREGLYNILRKENIPIIEDGFNEELQHLGGHISPMSAICGEENSVIYIGSLSKILFPGLRIGWVFADKRFIEILESIKRSKNIHTSFLDQGILYEYMESGVFERYVKKVRSIYREKYKYCKTLVEKYIPHKEIMGDGGLYLFIKLDNINSKELLQRCYKRGVIFMPGDIFYTDGKGEDTIRLSFAKTSMEEMERGIKIIGEEARAIVL